MGRTAFVITKSPATVVTSLQWNRAFEWEGRQADVPQVFAKE